MKLIAWKCNKGVEIEKISVSSDTIWELELFQHLDLERNAPYWVWRELRFSPDSKYFAVIYEDEIIFFKRENLSSKYSWLTTVVRKEDLGSGWVRMGFGWHSERKGTIAAVYHDGDQIKAIDLKNLKTRVVLNEDAALFDIVGDIALVGRYRVRESEDKLLKTSSADRTHFYSFDLVSYELKSLGLNTLSFQRLRCGWQIIQSMYSSQWPLVFYSRRRVYKRTRIEDNGTQELWDEK